MKMLIEEIRHRAKTNPLLTYKPLPQIDRFRQDKAKIKIVFGGNRSGKSEGLGEYITRKNLDIPRARIWACGTTFNDSVNIQQRKIAHFLPRHEVTYGKYDEINGFTNRKLQFKNRSLTTFKSYDQGREAYQGEDIDVAWLDEEPPIEVWKEIKMRLLDRDGELVLSMTSLSGVTDLIENVFDGHMVVESRYAEYVDEYLPVVAEKDGIRIYFLWTTDNPHINQDRVRQEIKMMSKQEIKARIYGIPINLQGKIFPKFNTDIHVVDVNSLDWRFAQIWNVLDPHDRKPWAVAWFAVWKTGHACLIDEYPEKNFNEMLYDDKTYNEYVQLIKQKEKILLQGVRNKFVKRIIDPNFGNKTVQLAERQGDQSKTTPRKELFNRGLKYEDGIDAVEAGHLEVRSWLYWDEKHGEIVVQPKLFIAEHCTNAIRHLSRYSRKDINSSDGDVKDKVKPMEKYKDFCDLVRYFVMANPRYIEKKEHKSDNKRVY